MTLRLDRGQFKRLAALAAAENRTPTNFVETLVLRELDANDERRRVISMFVAPEAATMTPGELVRSEGESEERYQKRKATFEELLSIPDNG